MHELKYIPDTVVQESVKHTSKKRKFYSVGPIDQKHLYKQRRLLDCDLKDFIRNNDVVSSLDKTFSNTIDPVITFEDQYQNATGTCWMSSGLNMIRYKTIKHLGLPKNFSFSRAHLFFWFKLEKINKILHCACVTKSLNINNPRVINLYKEFKDSGNFWTFKDIVEKYGLIPEFVYREDTICKSSDFLNKLISNELAISINTIRKHTGDSFVLIPDIMAHYKKIMATVMSVPPDTFIFECETSEKTIKIGPVTPVQFYRDFCDIKLNEYICVVSNKNKPYNKVLRFPSNHQYNSAIVDVPHTDIFNVSHNRFVQLAKKSILENNATPFSCIVDTNISRLHCLMDLNIYNYNHLDLHFTEHYDRSAVNIHNIKTHAMVLCGVDINSNSKKISRWKVHNSWSDDTPYVMAHNWFLRNVIRIFIHIDILNKKERELYKLSKKDNECIIIKHNEQSALQ